MSNENVIDDKIIASLRSLRPDRWNRWIEAGRRGEEQGRKLALLIKASKEIPYYKRLSHFVQVCVEKSGVSTDQASQVLGINLRDNCRAMDEASISTLEAAHLLQLNREYVKFALLLACLSAEDATKNLQMIEPLPIDSIKEGLKENRAKTTANSQAIYDKTEAAVDNYFLVNGT